MHSYTTYKNKLKMAWRLKHKTWHHTIPRREHMQNIIWHKFYQCFLRSVAQGNRNINKNTEMRPNETSKLLHSKENHKQHEKTNYGMGEDICKQCNWQGVNFQNMQWLIQVNNNKNRQPSRKMGRKTK